MAADDTRATWLRLLAAVLVVGAAYVALAVVVGRQVPSRASVEGVDVGGMRPTAAAAVLKQNLAQRASAPVVVTVGDTGRTLKVDPSSSGLSLDVDATLADMSGFTLNPVKIWQHLTGGVHRAVETSVDTAQLAEAVRAGATTVDTPARDGTVTFTGGRVAVTPAQVGTAVDVADLVRRIADGYPHLPSLVARVRTASPTVTQAKVDAAVSSFARPAMSAPISLVLADRTLPLVPTQLAPLLSMTPDDEGTLRPTIDRAGVTQLVTGLAESSLPQALDAGIELKGATPTVVPGVAGLTVDAATVPDVVLAALTDPARTARPKTTPTPPAFTTQQAKALGVNEVIASFDSTFPVNPSRTANLVAASNTIDGTLVKPGGTFSLNGILGKRTADKGYQEGYVIEGGRLVKGTGGGISQVSTVVYNLAWFAAAELVEHTAHSFYISRYPEGREATVYWPTIDNTWKNTSPYGMYVQMYVADNQVHGRIWSTKVFDVTSTKGPRSNVHTGRTYSDDSVVCVPQPGSPGFDVTVTRVISQKGKVVTSESYTTKYDPEDVITCTNPNHAN
ncbi:MAG: VanW family protein [Actinomycetota bacterium]|nr:VanW family protein [Actinomycetota bacterium]